jgi:hypothetical protein
MSRRDKRDSWVLSIGDVINPTLILTKGLLAITGLLDFTIM